MSQKEGAFSRKPQAWIHQKTKRKLERLITKAHQVHQWLLTHEIRTKRLSPDCAMHHKALTVCFVAKSATALPTQVPAEVQARCLAFQQRLFRDGKRQVSVMSWKRSSKLAWIDNEAKWAANSRDLVETSCKAVWDP